MTVPRPSLVLVVPALLAVPLAGCGGSHVALPTDDATPQQVVQAYVSAVNAKDCDTAKQLYSQADLWCGKSTLTDLKVTSTTQESKEGSPSTTVQHVNVTFTLHGGDGSMSDGLHDWGYLLDRTGPNKAWRIYDEGVA